MTQTNFYGRKNFRVTIQPNIGLDTVVRQEIVAMLNLVLADEAVLALITSRAEARVDGLNAPELQTLYGAQNQQINAISAELIQRIVILGGSPLGGAKDFINTSRLGGEIPTGPGIINLLADHEAFIRFLREDAQKCSEMYEDQGTFALLVSVMRIHEKMAWLLRSNIALEQFDHEK